MLLAVIAVGMQTANPGYAGQRTTPSLLAAYHALADSSNLSATEKFAFAAHLLKNSLPNSHSFAKAVTLLHSAANDGEPKALYLLAEFYQGGIHVNRDPEKAEQLIADAIRRDASAGRASQLPLGLLSCAEMLRKEGLSAAASSVPDGAAYSIGWCLLAGGHKERQSEGVRHVLRAAGAGDARAQLTAGSLYDSGLLLTKSATKAADWYMRAFSSVDRSPAALDAGYRYLLLWIRRLIREDLGAIRMILPELVRYNHVEGKLLAAQLAFSERLDVFTPDETFQLASDVATAGYGIGYLLSAACYERGVGTRQNWAKAAELYGIAGKAGLAIGYARLGDIHAIGLGHQPDVGRALAAYEKAVELGYTEAEANLAAIRRLASPSR